MGRAAERLVGRSLDLSQSLLLFWAPLKTKQLFRSLGEWAGITHSNENYVVSKLQRGPQGIVPLFWLQEGTDAT